MRNTFVRDNWMGVLGLLIGIGGTLFSWYTYQKSRRDPQPTFVVDPTRTEILSRERVSGTPIRVTRADGHEVKSDLTSVRFYFWNAGTESIRASNVLEPLVIEVDDPTAEVLQARLIRRTRAVTKADIQVINKRSILLRFAILEPGDGLTGQVLLEGEPQAQLLIRGTVERARLRTTADIISQRERYEFWKTGGMLVMLILVAFAPPYVYTLIRSAQEWPRSAKIAGAAALIALVAATLGVMAYAVGSEIANVTKRASEAVVQSVPVKVKPGTAG